jgi:hypothetical protein
VDLGFAPLVTLSRPSADALFRAELLSCALIVKLQSI